MAARRRKRHREVSFSEQAESRTRTMLGLAIRLLLWVCWQEIRTYLLEVRREHLGW